MLQLPNQRPDDEAFSVEFRRLVDQAAAVYSRSLGEVTAATYRRRWKQFQQWCDEHGHEALPAPPASSGRQPRRPLRPGRSLRAGFITTASGLELPLEMIATQSRHASLDVLPVHPCRRRLPAQRRRPGRAVSRNLAQGLAYWHSRTGVEGACHQERRDYLAFCDRHRLPPCPDAVAVYLVALHDERPRSIAALRYRLRQLDLGRDGLRLPARGTSSPAAQQAIKLELDTPPTNRHG